MSAWVKTAELEVSVIQVTRHKIWGIWLSFPKLASMFIKLGVEAGCTRRRVHLDIGLSCSLTLPGLIQVEADQARLEEFRTLFA